jgi:hypothetical protein
MVFSLASNRRLKYTEVTLSHEVEESQHSCPPRPHGSEAFAAMCFVMNSPLPVVQIVSFQRALSCSS